MYADGNGQSAFTQTDCVCKPGHGVGAGGFCRLCGSGTYSPGGTKDACLPCGEGWKSDEGSVSWHDCYQEVPAQDVQDGPPLDQAPVTSAMVARYSAAPASIPGLQGLQAAANRHRMGGMAGMAADQASVAPGAASAPVKGRQPAAYINTGLATPQPAAHINTGLATPQAWSAQVVPSNIGLAPPAASTRSLPADRPGVASVSLTWHFKETDAGLSN